MSHGLNSQYSAYITPYITSFKEFRLWLMEINEDLTAMCALCIVSWVAV